MQLHILWPYIVSEKITNKQTAKTKKPVALFNIKFDIQYVWKGNVHRGCCLAVDRCMH